jgi:hypothetical protein
LHVRDRSRDADSAGTEIPVVRQGDLRSDVLHLLNIPSRHDSRTLLRVYDLGTAATPRVNVRMFDLASGATLREFSTDLAPGGPNAAAHAAVALLPGDDPFGLEVRPAHEGMRIWAFVTVTNNRTQAVTVVSPQ